MKSLKLAAAILVAATYSMFSRSRSFWGTFADFWRLIRSPKASPELRDARMAACRRCTFFFAPLETCGSPLRWKDREFGCFCHLPTKSARLDADCWSRLNMEDAGFDGTDGWPDSLRPPDATARDDVGHPAGDAGSGSATS